MLIAGPASLPSPCGGKVCNYCLNRLRYGSQRVCISRSCVQFLQTFSSSPSLPGLGLQFPPRNPTPQTASRTKSRQHCPAFPIAHTSGDMDAESPLPIANILTRPQQMTATRPFPMCLPGQASLCAPGISPSMSQ